MTDLSHQGISDIALRSRKVAGTAIYRNRELVFYHAIINLSGTTEAMERYLKLPPRTPDYRRGRSHAEFVTSLAEEGHSITASDVHCAVSRRFLDLISSQSA